MPEGGTSGGYELPEVARYDATKVWVACKAHRSAVSTSAALSQSPDSEMSVMCICRTKHASNQ